MINAVHQRMQYGGSTSSARLDEPVGQGDFKLHVYGKRETAKIKLLPSVFSLPSAVNVMLKLSNITSVFYSFHAIHK